MPNLVEELNSLDFKDYIGGPMQACVQAQHAASMSTVEFIQNVGFETDDQGVTDIRYVQFKVQKQVQNPDFDDESPANETTNPLTVPRMVTVEVPFITMLNVPSLRIDELIIDFNAKLTSTETRKVDSEFEASAELGIDYKVVNFKASASYKRKSSRGLSVEKTYNLGVRVTAVNDELPAGLDRVLTMLEDNIRAA